jgi:hypothetical protein
MRWISSACPRAREEAMGSTVTADEWQVRCDLAACYRLVDMFGWSDLINTRITARVPAAHDHFLINPYGLLFDEITASSLVKIDAYGDKVEPSEAPATDWYATRRETQDKPMSEVITAALVTPAPPVHPVFPPIYYDESETQIILGLGIQADDTLTAAITVGEPYFRVAAIDVCDWVTDDAPVDTGVGELPGGQHQSPVPVLPRPRVTRHLSGRSRPPTG